MANMQKNSIKTGKELCICCQETNYNDWNDNELCPNCEAICETLGECIEENKRNMQYALYSFKEHGSW